MQAKMTKAHWQRLALTIASGVLMATLNFSPHRSDQGSPQFLLSLFFFFIALNGVGPRWGFRLGFIWGILTYGITLSWMWTIFQGISAGLWSLLALFIAIFGSWYGAVTSTGNAAPHPISSRRLKVFTKKNEPFWIIPLAAVVWTGIEYFRCEWFVLRFPWITPGTILRPNLLTPYLGTYGLTFLVVLGVAWVVSRPGKGRFTNLAFPVILLFLLAWTPPKPATLPPGESITVALVQSEQGFFAVYKELTETIEEPLDAIIWPEYALGYDIRKDPSDLAASRALLQKTGAKFLTLGSRTDIDDEGNYYNTAITLGPDTVLGTHYKNRPVHFFSDGEAGETLNAIPTPIGRIATPVCFDCDYTAVARRLVMDGAEVFLVPSMDAEHWTVKQHEQHAQLFRHRAAENGRWIAVAATSGVTQIIDPAGNLIDRLPTMTEDILIGQVGVRSHLTFYTRFGWILGPTCTFATIAILLGTIIVRLRAKRTSSPNVQRRLPLRSP